MPDVEDAKQLCSAFALCGVQVGLDDLFPADEPASEAAA